jgi:signal transduction histidine kinase
VAELKQSEHLAAIGKMISVVSHEIRNPLQNIQLGFEMLRKAFLDDEQIETLSDIERGLQMLNETVDDLLDFARPARLNRRPCKVETVIKHSLSLLQPRLQNISLQMDFKQGDKLILFDPEKMSRVVINLMLNAIEAVPAGGEVRLFADFFKEEEKSYLKICISDNGIGIDDAILLQITEPFFTTKPHGTGLGLSICRKIIEAHGGRMSITSKIQMGTTVELIIPAEGPIEGALGLL